MDYKEAYKALADQLTDAGIDVEAVKADLKTQAIETPSWGYGDMGTRFQVFHERGTAPNLFEKLTDAAQVHKLTGICPTVAVHIPWDEVDDYAAAQQHAESLGIAIGAVNPNYFQEPEYRLGSMCHPDPAVRRQALDATLGCIEIAETVGSEILSLWFADGTNYPGQDSFRGRKHRMEAWLAEVYQALPADMRMLVEYKFFEPAFYHTDIADWGMSYALCLGLGPRAQVLVDTGHHAQGTNIEHIVAFLIDQGKLGGFHFNNRKYADDDLMTSSINPYEIFLIFNELIDGARDPETANTVANIAYMVDQSHNIEPKIEAMIQTVVNIQTAYAKALLVDREALAEGQKNMDVLGANRILTYAYETDVRPLLAIVREEMDCPPDPMAAYKASGYYEKVQEERG